MDSISGNTVEGSSIDVAPGNIDTNSNAKPSLSPAKGKTIDRVPLEEVEPLGFDLETLPVFPGHFEITGSSGKKIFCNQIHHDQHAKAPSFFLQGYRAIMRTQKERDAYRLGMQHVRDLLLEKYDQNAVSRFDKHFAYRMWAGKPLTVRALESFLDEEENLRLGTLNINNIEEKNQLGKLENLKIALGPKASKNRNLVIGGSKVATPKKEYAFPFLPIKRSWFESAANAEDRRQGEKDGIDESLRIILDLLPAEATHTKTHVEHLFTLTFADRKKTEKPLQVKELSNFVDDAIKVRDYESGVLGPLRIMIEEARQEGADVEAAVSKFVQGSYHALGILAGVSIMLDQARNTSDPITLALKEIFAGGAVASETDTQRILTAVMLHYVGSSPAQQTSSTSRIIKFFTPFY